MRGSNKTALFLVFLGLVHINAVNVIWEDDDSASVEISDDNEIDASDERNARIYWPYPLEHNFSKRKFENNDQRQKRFLFPRYSYPQSPIADLMKQTMAYEPNSKDIFAFLRDTYPLPKGFSQPLDEYDYVIIGAGSAGSVLASRLTEDKPRATVLLIEAGKPECLLSDIPIFAPYLQLSDYSWPYSTEPQPGICLGSEGQRCYWPRGKAVGGSSVTNYMLYSRGRPQDWDRIAGDGNYGWSFSEVLPYFIKSQKSTLKKYKDTSYSGQHGELLVSNPPFRTGLVEAFLEAGRINGHPTVDYNSPYDELGFGYIQTTTFKGHRWSTAKAFLHSHKRRRNLHILTESRATKIIIEPHSKKAYAVEYIRNNIKRVVRARREIILSAGPIASPQLLMLSGIGPKEHLQHLGIPVIADLQVGRLLYDHLVFPGVVFELNTTNASLLEPKLLTVPNLVQWLTYGDSLLASPGTVESLGFFKTNVSDDPEDVPDIELVVLGAGLALDCGGIFRQSWRIADETYYPAFGALCNRDQWQPVPMLLHPKSKGYLELRDANPLSFPKIYSNYLTDRRDVETMLAAIRHTIKLGESEPFKKYGAQLYRASYPQCAGYTFGTDDYWECALRVMGVTLFHPTSTCKMGPPSDPGAIVDPELRVYGVEGLRVVDTSIIPRTTSAHLNALAIMIAERAADMIKHTWANVAYSSDPHSSYARDGYYYNK